MLGAAAIDLSQLKGKLLLNLDSEDEGVFTVSDKGVTVALDTLLTPELIEEGFVKELVSKIQTMRKDSGFNVTDRINVSISGNAKVFDIAKKNEDAISAVVLSDSISDAALANGKEWDINGENVTIAVAKV